MSLSQSHPYQNKIPNFPKLPKTTASISPISKLNQTKNSKNKRQREPPPTQTTKTVRSFSSTSSFSLLFFLHIKLSTKPNNFHSHSLTQIHTHTHHHHPPTRELNKINFQKSPVRGNHSNPNKKERPIPQPHPYEVEIPNRIPQSKPKLIGPNGSKKKWLWACFLLNSENYVAVGYSSS